MHYNFSMNYLNFDMQFMLGLSAAARYVTSRRTKAFQFCSYMVTTNVITYVILFLNSL